MKSWKGLVKALVGIAYPFRSKPKDLGCADDWTSIPKEVTECICLDHETVKYAKGVDVAARVECVYCNYFYTRK